MIDAHDQEIILDQEKLKADKKVAEAEYADHQKLLDDWREVLKLPSGRRIVWDLLGVMGFQREMFHTDSLIMARNCGQYSLCISLLAIIEEATPGITFKIQNEFRRTLNKE